MSDRKKNLEIRHVKGSGPGGQHRNKRQTGIVVTHVPTGLTVRSTERRSQSQNLSDAIDRLETKVAEHFYRPPARKKTKKSKAAERNRLKKKMRHGEKKRMRRKDYSSD
jgi:protein subunit release factor A